MLFSGASLPHRSHPGVLSLAKSSMRLTSPYYKNNKINKLYYLTETLVKVAILVLTYCYRCIFCYRIAVYCHVGSLENRAISAI